MIQEAGAPLLRLAVALLAGMLIGLDRERAEQRKAREIFAGIRTFPLIALAGCLPMMVFETTGIWLVAAAALGVLGVIVIAYWRATQQGHVGATTEVAGICTFLVGVLAGSGQILLAGTVGIVVATLLVAKPNLEGLSRAMTPAEVAAVLELAVISGIVLPILPDRGYGPWGALNPREIWLVVVLVAGLSFTGFVAIRLLGENRGLVITGAVGGLVSSTAVTVAMADRSKETPSLARPAAAAAILASSIMSLRVAFFAGLIGAGVVPRLLPACLVMAVCGAVVARVLARAEASQVVKAGERVRNPFSLRQAVFFAVIYGAISLGVRAVQEYMTAGAMFAAAAVGAIADTDAVTIALARLGAGTNAWREVAAAITLAAVTNTLVKLGIGWFRGDAAFRRYAAGGLGSMAVLGAGTGAAVYFLG